MVNLEQTSVSGVYDALGFIFCVTFYTFNDLISSDVRCVLWLCCLLGRLTQSLHVLQHVSDVTFMVCHGVVCLELNCLRKTCTLLWKRAIRYECHPCPHSMVYI